ncbi:endonuclease/exonuclease/phosphatase family protein [Luteimonas abyssi]|uniref:endonuclease/exonuclease/phosphatase family protein n=1 Tax=Luteimonas abyssi TaxID=1247514 RepID=UPI000737BCE8|nr:endonuclease/exonuclease/phosphatase family protein [Luteimonas abyssi]
MSARPDTPRRWRVLRIAALLATLWTAAATGAEPAPSATPAGRVSAVTLNLYHDRDHWERRRPLVIEGLRALSPDVIALQEVLQDDDLRNQAEDIADALGYTTLFVSTDPAGQPRRYGNAILTRLPVRARSERRLAPLEDARTVGHVRIDVEGRLLDVFVTHLHASDDGGAIRARQLQDLLAHVDAHAGDGPALVLGDFNAEADTPELGALAGAGFVDALATANPAAASQTTLNPHYFERGRRIDHVFARGLRVLDAQRVLDRPDADGTWPSDHFGVHADVALEP